MSNVAIENEVRRRTQALDALIADSQIDPDYGQQLRSQIVAQVHSEAAASRLAQEGMTWADLPGPANGQVYMGGEFDQAVQNAKTARARRRMVESLDGDDIGKSIARSFGWK